MTVMPHFDWLRGHLASIILETDLTKTIGGSIAEVIAKHILKVHLKFTLTSHLVI